MSSSDTQTTDPLTLAHQAERDLNSQAAKGNTSKGQSDSTVDSGIDASATQKFPGSTVAIDDESGSLGRTIPVSEGGDVLANGRTTRAEDFEGVGGPEDKAAVAAQERGGDDEIRENVRQGGETRRP